MYINYSIVIVIIHIIIIFYKNEKKKYFKKSTTFVKLTPRHPHICFIKYHVLYTEYVLIIIIIIIIYSTYVERIYCCLLIYLIS